jgi:LysM repeat protein
MLRLAMAATFGLFLSLIARAQESPPAAEPNTALELKSLRETVQLQSAQLEKITQQLDDVLHRLGVKSAAPQSNTPEAAAATLSEAPKAVAVSDQPTHTVKKGETLTSIAHQYGVTVDELQKANHITDGRRLQIEQNLIIPAPSAKKAAPVSAPTVP